MPRNYRNCTGMKPYCGLFIFACVLLLTTASVSAASKGRVNRDVTPTTDTPTIAPTTGEVGRCCVPKKNKPSNFNYIAFIIAECAAISIVQVGTIIDSQLVLTSGSLLLQTGIQSIKVCISPNGTCLQGPVPGQCTDVEEGHAPGNMLPADWRLCNGLAIVKTKQNLEELGGSVFPLNLKETCPCNRLVNQPASIVQCSNNEIENNPLTYEGVTITGANSSYASAENPCSQLFLQGKKACAGLLGAPLFDDETNTLIGVKSHCKNCSEPVATCLYDYQYWINDVISREFKKTITFFKASEILKNCQYTPGASQVTALESLIKNSGVCEFLKNELIDYLHSYIFDYKKLLKDNSVNKLALNIYCGC